MKKKHKNIGTIQNRKARHDYSIGEDFVTGLVLNGRETKALRLGQGSLQGAFVVVRDSELWLTNSLVSGQGNLHLEEADQTRSRKLLAKKREIAQLIAAKQQGLAIVPLEFLTRGRFIKLRIATAQGKKKYDKRETLKKRDQQRQIDTAIKTRVGK